MEKHCDKNIIEADFHIHSMYSMDSFLNPSKIVKIAKKKGLSAIAVTDHETTRGAKEAIRQNPFSTDLLVIPGIEIKTEIGDIIGLFIEEDITAKGVLEVIEKIKEQDGLVVLAHPIRKHKPSNSILQKIDLIEGLNGRSSYLENLQARVLAYSLTKPVIAGSDAHFSFEIGCVRMRLFKSISDIEELRTLIKEGRRELIGKESPYFVHMLSFGVEVIKKFL